MKLKMEEQNKMKVLGIEWAGLLLLMAAAAPVAMANTADPRLMINKACNGTLYPDICRSAVSPLSDCLGLSRKTQAQHMVKNVLGVALADARLLSSWAHQVLRMRGIEQSDRAPMAGCADDRLDDATVLIHDSLARLKHLRPRPADAQQQQQQQQLSDVRTWLKAALTDYSTCVEGFRKAKRTESFLFALLEMLVVRSSSLASVSLALLNAADSDSPPPSE